MSIHQYVTDGLSRDEIIVKLVAEQGYTLSKATKAYAAYAKSAGLTNAIVSHKEEALNWLKEQYDDNPEEWTAQAVKDSVIELGDRHGIAESTARDYCKAYSQQLGVEHPVLDPRTAIFEWFKKHDGNCTKKQFLDYAINELNRSRSNANEYWKGYELHEYLTKTEKEEQE